MNVASLELSKELYELSGWDDTYLRWVPGLDHAVNPDEAVRNRYVEDPDFPSTPAYDLGYLLRKLPDFTQIAKTNLYVAELDGPAIRYYAAAPEEDVDTDYYDNPEDAAAVLAIKLLGRGVLTRDGDE